MVRLNLFKTPKPEEPKTAEVIAVVKTETMPEPPTPPKSLSTKKQVEEPAPIQYVEREVTLSLLNDKLNYLTARVEDFLAAKSKEEERK